jgi:hypothetical protein
VQKQKCPLQELPLLCLPAINRKETQFFTESRLKDEAASGGAIYSNQQAGIRMRGIKMSKNFLSMVSNNNF